MKKKFTPNKVLPKGARLIKPVRLKLGNWAEMVYDAKVLRAGLNWYRVKGGMGDSHHLREDWCADVPEICISVHDYHWNGDPFGTSYGSFNKAVKGESEIALSCALTRLKELQEKIKTLTTGISILKGALDV